MSSNLKCSVLESLSEALLAHANISSPEVSDGITNLLKALDADLDGLGYESSETTGARAEELDEAVLQADSEEDAQPTGEEEKDDEPEPKQF